MDLCRGTHAIFTYAKLGRFAIIGFVHEPNPERWKGSKVDAAHGVIRPRRYELPRAFGGYLTAKAEESHRTLANLSDRQRLKVEAAFRANVDKFVASDAFIAMNADVEMFGDDAFTARED